MCQGLPLMQKKLYDLLSVMNLGFKARITITTELNDYKKLPLF